MLKVALLLSLAAVQAPTAPAGRGFSDLSDFADEAQAPASIPVMGFRDMSEFPDEAPLSVSSLAFEMLFGGVLLMAAVVLLGPIAGVLYLVAWRNPMVWARGRLPRTP